MAKMKDKQPGVEGSASEQVTEGEPRESMDANPAEIHMAADGAAPPVEVVAPAEPVKPELSDSIKAKLLRLASQYGHKHDGDHEAFARKLGALWGMFDEDLVSLVGKLCAHAGV